MRSIKPRSDDSASRIAHLLIFIIASRGDVDLEKRKIGRKNELRTRIGTVGPGTPATASAGALSAVPGGRVRQPRSPFVSGPAPAQNSGSRAWILLTSAVPSVAYGSSLFPRSRPRRAGVTGVVFTLLSSGLRRYALTGSVCPSLFFSSRA